MLRRNLDLGFILLLAGAGLAAQRPQAWAAAHVLLGVCLAVVCPGYALAAAVLPDRSLRSGERVALSVGLSFAATILGAVVLNIIPAGLTTPVWGGWAVAVTAAGSAVAFWRRQRSLPVRPRPGRHLRPVEWLELFLAGLVTLSAVWLVRVPITASGVVGYTLLSMAPATTQNQPGVHISIRSSELSMTGYRLTLTDDGVVVRTWPAVNLAPGAAWEQTVAIGSAHPGGQIQAQLYRLAAPEAVYRSVSLVLGT